METNDRPCGRRVQKLYLPPGGRQFGCRHCYHLGYETRKLNAKRRAQCRAQKIRERLGGKPWDEGFPKKPPRMWLRKYERLRMEAEEAEKKFRC